MTSQFTKMYHFVDLFVRGVELGFTETLLQLGHGGT